MKLRFHFQVEVNGLRNFRTERINADVVNRVLSLDLFVPTLNVAGKYEVNGQVLFFPLVGTGPFTSVLRGVRGGGKAKILPVGPVGNQRLTVSDTLLDFDIASVDVELKNLFGGNNEAFARQINEVLSESSDLIIDQVKPQITQRVSTLVEKVLNDAFSKIDVQDFIRTIEETRSSAAAAAGSGIPAAPFSTSGRLAPPPPLPAIRAQRKGKGLFGIFKRK